jgi:hypothetical protein
MTDPADASTTVSSNAEAEEKEFMEFDFRLGHAGYSNFETIGTGSAALIW